MGKQLPILKPAADSRPTKPRFNCLNCPGKCCTYPLIEITPADIRRLAKHHGMTEEAARQKFTKKEKGDDGEAVAVLRHRKDEHYESACIFLHPTKRICTIYNARPAVCRQYPFGNRCGYYEYLIWERKHQDDPDFVA